MRKNTSPVWDPENYCPICGGMFKGASAHRCPQATLSGINGANTRACRDDLNALFPPKSMQERLADGFAMMDGRTVM